MTSPASRDFVEFVRAAEPRLRRALVAAYGAERGREATAEALAYGWEHWDKVSTMENPTGYLYRVGQSRSRPRKLPPVFPPVSESNAHLVEPSLPAALYELSDRERQAVVLIKGFEWTGPEVAELLEVSVSAVQSYLERGLAKLRARLAVIDDV